ncbi:hypothetical protein NDU88_003463 [Pleurodeles waltl]|uniref:Uncharacterized protein n=1 Tax=Pleurodeles waltl TaxID=8319 RepID=A0AAV7LFE4_PLEWA|nr:hypothetical protein NDU88_003463 [Pleurodeles waltl]
MGRKRRCPEMQRGDDPEENPGGEDWTDRTRPWKSRIRRRPESLGDEQTGADTLTVPTQGRRPPSQVRSSARVKGREVGGGGNKRAQTQRAQTVGETGWKGGER